MEIQNFITKFKKTFVYEVLSQTLTDEQLFAHTIKDGEVIWFKEQMRQMWTFYKAQAVPEGFVLMPMELTENMVKSVWLSDYMLDFMRFRKSKFENALRGAYRIMIEAQEPAND